ncbi:hypothetical protein [Streptomyces odonnellii]|uniref:hypothetical protein n=1 Tax=Streptomyces odonnellii TaxID=1417980 RepID=UPI000A614DF9|nr:hypothetical protein [Streptomyces odonnellii]
MNARQMPKGRPARGPVAVARGLLEAEAAQRGIGVTVLVGRLARQARRRVPADTS